METALRIVFAALFGLAIGSFLTMATYRVPRKESIVAPRSRCPTCGTEIATRDNVPVMSYVLLAGRCRTCRTRISFRYPLIELATAALFVVPVAVHGFAHWSPRAARDPNALPPRIARELKSVPARAVIIAPLELSYRILAAAPVYVVAAPPAHVADTSKNRPYVRRRALLHWLATHDPAVPRRYGATWEVTRGQLRPIDVG